MERRCVTRVMTRDVLLVLLPAGAPSPFLYPGLDVVAEVELPAASGRAIRNLKCASEVRSLERTADGIEAILDVKSMAITQSDHRRHDRLS